MNNMTSTIMDSLVQRLRIDGVYRVCSGSGREAFMRLARRIYKESKVTIGAPGLDKHPQIL